MAEVLSMSLENIEAFDVPERSELVFKTLETQENKQKNDITNYTDEYYLELFYDGNSMFQHIWHHPKKFLFNEGHEALHFGEVKCF